MSNNTLPLVVSERSNTGFLVTVKTTTTISLLSNIFLVCLIVYFNSDVKNTLFNFSVQFNTSDYVSIGNKFPNYTYNQFATSTSGSIQNNEFNTTFPPGKGSYSYGEYNTFASYETSTRSHASILSSAAKSFIFPSTTTGQRTNAQYNCSFLTNGTSSISFNVNTVAFFLLHLFTFQTPIFTALKK